MHKDHPGTAMVAFFLSGEDAGRLAVQDGEPVSNLHVTSIYIGDTAEIQPSRVPLRDATQTLARRTAPFSGVLDRLSHFGPDDDGLMAVVLQLTSDGAHVFRWNLESALAARHIPWNNKFPEYKPHVTLGYWKEGDIPPNLSAVGPIDPIRVTFSEVSVVWDGERTNMSLGGNRPGDNSIVESLVAVQASAIEETESITAIQASAFTLLEFHGSEHNEKSHGRRGPNKPSLKSLQRNIPSLKSKAALDSDDDMKTAGREVNTRQPSPAGLKKSDTETQERFKRGELTTSMSEASPEAQQSMATRVAKTVPGMEGADTPEEAINRQVENIVGIFDRTSQDEQDAWRQWYTAAHQYARDLVERFTKEREDGRPEMSIEAGAAAIAVLSPQKDWHMNVALSAHVIDVLQNPQKWKMDKAQAAFANQQFVDSMRRGADTSEARLNKSIESRRVAIELGYVVPTSGNNKGKKVPLDAKKREEYAKDIAEKDAAIADLSKIRAEADRLEKEPRFREGQTIEDFPDQVDGAYLVRAVNPNPELRTMVVAKDGSYTWAEGRTTATGEVSKSAWGSYTEIGKAVSVLRDMSDSNISDQLGNKHKVRNFFNNIVAPNSKRGDVTIDTHAFGALFGIPMTTNHPNIKTGDKNITGTGGSKGEGFDGAYGLSAEAMRRAADLINARPENEGRKPFNAREIQSVTWEKWKEMWPPKARTSAAVKQIEKLRSDVAKGKMTLREAERRIELIRLDAVAGKLGVAEDE